MIISLNVFKLTYEKIFRKNSVANYKLSVLENSKAFKYEFDDIKLKLVNWEAILLKANDGKVNQI